MALPGRSANGRLLPFFARTASRLGMAAWGGYRCLMGQGREALLGVDAFGCLRSLRARSALDGVPTASCARVSPRRHSGSLHCYPAQNQSLSPRIGVQEKLSNLAVEERYLRNKDPTPRRRSASPGSGAVQRVSGVASYMCVRPIFSRGVILSGRVSTENPSPTRLHKFRRRPSMLPPRALASPRWRHSNRTHGLPPEAPPPRNQMLPDPRPP